MTEQEAAAGKAVAEEVKGRALRKVGGLALESAELVGALAQVDVNGKSMDYGKMTLIEYISRAREILRRHI